MKKGVIKKMYEKQEFKNGFTQMSNEALEEIFIRGLLSETEMRIAFYIIRQSTGYHRDWTNERTVQKIADDIGMRRSFCSRTINQMIRENKIIREDDRFRFNENYKEWTVSSNPNGDHLVNGTVASSKWNGTVSDNTEQINAPDTPKYTLNKQRNKDIYINKKDININISRENQNIIKKHSKEEQQQALSLIYWFSKNILEVDQPAPGFVNREIKHAYRLLGIMDVSEIQSVCLWRKQTADDFWRKKFVSLGNLWTHLTDWAAEARVKSLTFTDWLDKNPAFDYRKLDDDYAKVKAFFLAFNRAEKEGAVPTSEEWKKYQLAREINKKQGERQWA